MMPDQTAADILRRLLAPHPGLLHRDDDCLIWLGGYGEPPAEPRPGEDVANRVTAGDLRRAGVLPERLP